MKQTLLISVYLHSYTLIHSVQVFSYFLKAVSSFAAFTVDKDTIVWFSASGRTILLVSEEASLSGYLQGSPLARALS